MEMTRKLFLRALLRRPTQGDFCTGNSRMNINSSAAFIVEVNECDYNPQVETNGVLSSKSK
jgi:hypothetical protein